VPLFRTQLTNTFTKRPEEVFHIRKCADLAPFISAGATRPRTTSNVETFLPGREFALKGLVTDGRLHVLGLFDKPDPLDGPYFEETIYVTPSRESLRVQMAIIQAAQLAVTALGLHYGPCTPKCASTESACGCSK
jgi:hypothetical protein